MKRIESFDFIKFFAIIGVLIIHNGLFYNLKVGGVDLTMLGFILETLSRFAVPYFFVTAGFLFTVKAREKGILNNYLPYIKKVGLLYIIWTLIYFANNCYTSIIWHGYTVSDYFYENVFISDILYYGKNISEPLWFLPALIFSVSALAVILKLRVLKFLLPFALTLNILGLFAKPQMLGFIGNLPFFTRDALFFGFFYTLLGGFLADKSRFENIKGSTTLWLLIFIVSSILIMVEKNILGNMNMWLDIGDYFLFTIPQTFSLLVLSLRKPELGNKSIITTFGKGALGIYLIHSLVQTWLQAGYYSFLGDSFWMSPWRQFTVIPILFILSWSLYYGIALVIKRVVAKNG